MFGAQGDGTTSDGAAFDRMIAAVNELAGSDECRISCKNKYVITGGARHARSFNRSSVRGTTEGISTVIRDNVTVDAREAEFIVAAEFPWRRIKKGGDKKDHFAVGWHFVGKNCKLIGGRMLGNLSAREVIRGPSPSGFGGAEYGLIMEGEGWQLDGVYAENWGTDCLLIGAPGRSLNGTYIGARRNCVSLVPTMPFSSNSFAEIVGGRISRGGKWPEDVRNNPGAGIDIEGLENGFDAIASITGVEFDENEMKDLQLSRSALNCVIENCTFRNNVKIQPKQKGGHQFRKNRFLGEARIETMFGLRGNRPIMFTENEFEVAKFSPFRHNVIPDLDRDKQGQKVIFLNNRALNWKGNFSDLPIFRDGNVFENNMTGLSGPATTG